MTEHDLPPGLALLADARALVESGWSQEADARDSDGEPVEPWEARAASWSLLGAIVAVLEREAARDRDVPLNELAAALTALAHRVDSDSLSAWNDAPERSAHDVANALTVAAELYSEPATAAWFGADTPRTD